MLGLDDAMFRDHDWGLRLTLLVDEDFVQPVNDYLETELPKTFRAGPTRFPRTWQPMIRHRIEVTTSARFAFSRLGSDAHGAMTPLDWLSLTGQSVLEVTDGAVFRDDQGAITNHLTLPADLSTPMADVGTARRPTSS